MLSSVFAAAFYYNPSNDFSGTTGLSWETDTHENPLVYTTQEPVLSFSGSDDSTPKTNSSNSGSDDDPIDERKRKHMISPIDERKRKHMISPIDERKRKRMISNRESARRSRMRKQKHLENLRNLVNRHKSENREIRNRLLIVLYHKQALGQENVRLRSESVLLQKKLGDLDQEIRVSQIPNELLSSAWPCNNNSNETSTKNKTNRH